MARHNLVGTCDYVLYIIEDKYIFLYKREVESNFSFSMGVCDDKFLVRPWSFNIGGGDRVDIFEKLYWSYGPIFLG